MIHYQLRCSADHGFDGWFKDSAAFDKQAKAGLVQCPVCGGSDVSRALMAPSIAKRSRAAPEAPPQAPLTPTPAAAPPQPRMAAGPLPAELRAMLQRLRAEVQRNCDYVGPDFADEARRLHREAQEGDAPATPRGIYGEATDSEAEALRDDGIEVARIPWVPLADA